MCRYSHRFSVEAHLGLVGVELVYGHGSAMIAAAGWGRGGAGSGCPGLGSFGHPLRCALPSPWPVVPGLHPGQFQPLRPEAVPADRHRLCQRADHRPQQQ